MPLPRDNFNGFTLIETVVVLILAGVFAAIALPRFQVAVEGQRAKEGEQTLIQVQGAVKRFLLEDPGGAASLTGIHDLDIELRPSAFFAEPTFVDLNANPLVLAIQRNGNLYTLQINPDATFTCTDPGSGICGKMGY